MLKRFKFFYIFLGCIFLSPINPIFNLNANGENSLNYELDDELNKGNFFIGLKQYLGGLTDNFSKNNKISFTVDKGFINLFDANGLTHKSKKIIITWKNLPIEIPYTIERLVFGPFSSYESARKQAKNLQEKEFKATIAYPDNWEVWIPFNNKLPNTESNYKLSKKKYTTRITPFLSNEYDKYKLKGPIYIEADDAIKINNINFGKKFYLTKDSYGTWTLIQKIKFDDYLEGVLPHEIGSNSPLEALKAQAVIARTWAIYNSERFSMDNYHLCVTTQCQVYKPLKLKNKKVLKAIEETSNLIITYRNKPINSFYHGSNGGISASASESWEIENYNYTKNKLDGSKRLKKHFTLPIHDEFELDKFLNFDEERFHGSNHYLFRWNKKIPTAIIRDTLIYNKLINNNEKVSNLNVIERGSSGRAIKLEIQINKSKRSVVILKDDIRRIFSFLPSNLFIINKLNDDLWLFRGGGFGHGVGLSQSGAIEMAKKGLTYEQILKHYYQGTILKNVEIMSQ